MNNNKGNSVFKKAREVKNDEFYTRLKDIIKELKHYKDKFRDKIVYLPCDNPEFSQFYYYFFNKFKTLGLKKLICSFYSPKSLFGNKNVDSYVTIVDKDKKITKIKLKEDGDFRSKELIPYWKEADIIVTNPPFSLFQEFINFIFLYEKDLILIGPISALRFKKVFLNFKKNKIFCNQNTNMKFISNNKEVPFGNICWFSSFLRSVPELELVEYNKNKHLTYTNYSAINVDNIHEIPNVKNKLIGVPITFLKYYNPNRFKIINLLHKPHINDKKLYSRVIIKLI